MYTQQSELNDLFKELKDEGLIDQIGGMITTSRTPMGQSDDDVIEDIKNDPNRVLLKKTIKSPQFGNFSYFEPHEGNDYEEVMVGGFKTLHKCSFINTSADKTISTTSTLLTSRYERRQNTKLLKKEEKSMKKNPSDCHYIKGQDSGIIHICYWIESLSCFVMWRHIPKNIPENIISLLHDESI